MMIYGIPNRPLYFYQKDIIVRRWRWCGDGSAVWFCVFFGKGMILWLNSDETLTSWDETFQLMMKLKIDGTSEFSLDFS